MVIRPYMPADCGATAELFYLTVHTVNAKDYSEEQLNAWADGKTDLREWNLSFSGHFAVVAEESGVIAGFGDITLSGYLDRLYIHKDFQGQGIASAICGVLERAADADKLFTHASITAKPFFERRGYTAVREQQVERSGVFLTNYVMEKPLRHRSEISRE